MGEFKELDKKNKLKKCKKRKKMYISTAVISIIAISLLSGCSSLSVKYSEEEEEIIANYAANLLLKHDERYKYNYISEEEITTENTDSQINASEEEAYFAEEDTENVADVKTMAQIFNMPEGLTAEFADYEITDKYPSGNSENELFVMKSLEDYMLLIVKFKVTNTTGQDINVNMMSYNAKYKGVVNETKKYNSQLTLLPDALNTYEGTITAGSSQTLVLVYQTQIDTKDDVKSLSVEVTDSSGNEAAINLK